MRLRRRCAGKEPVEGKCKNNRSVDEHHRLRCCPRLMSGAHGRAACPHGRCPRSRQASRFLRRSSAALMPWAWGINGCASVLSAVLAILLAMSLGFNAVVVIAIALYVVAAATLRWVRRGLR